MSLESDFLGLFTPPFPGSKEDAAAAWAAALQPHLGILSSAFVDLETPSGSVDGANPTFLLSQTPSPAGSLHLFVNGVLQLPGVHFGLSTKTITFDAGHVPQTGDTIRASYRF